MAVNITVSQILADLKSGLTRDEIGEKYGLNKAQVKAVFSHPKLKNKKTIKQKGAAFILVDDTEAVNEQQAVLESGEEAETSEEEIGAGEVSDDTEEQSVFDSQSEEAAPETENPVEQAIATSEGIWQ